MSKILFNTAGAVAAGDYDAPVGNETVTVHAVGLAGVEEVKIKVTTDEGATYQGYFEAGVEKVLTITDTMFSCYGPLIISFEKAVTAGPVTLRVVRAFDL